MAVYSVDIEKRLGSEFWTNRYIVTAASLAVASLIALRLREAEQLIHANIVTFTRHRISNLGEGNEEYVIVPDNVVGLRTNQGSLLPLFNTLRVDIPAATGRPSRKFYRGVLGEGDINGDLVTAEFDAFLLELQEHFAAGENPGVVDPQGQFLSAPSLYEFVQMRQLRRSRRRRANGGGIFQ